MSNVAELRQSIDPATVHIHLNVLAAEYLSLKRERDQLNKRLSNLEKQITDAVGNKPEGAFSTQTESYKFTTTGKKNRKVDESKLTELRKAISRTIFNKVFRTKHEIDLKEYRFLENNEPEIFAEVAKVVTTTPAKTALKIEVA